ncbi:MAG TPA: cation-transporting P-type ATPase, partial [Saprospiraceae bacterium]|nr:cation-transporting P-type ATPase [Saprospiraceae bacterium]
MKETSTPAFWSQDLQTWYQKLNSGPTGLTQRAAEYALQQAGNLIKKPSRLRQDFLLFIGQFRSPLMLLLIGAVILSAFLGDTSDV